MSCDGSTNNRHGLGIQLVLRKNGGLLGPDKFLVTCYIRYFRVALLAKSAIF